MPRSGARIIKGLAAVQIRLIQIYYYLYEVVLRRLRAKRKNWTLKSNEHRKISAGFKQTALFCQN